MMGEADVKPAKARSKPRRPLPFARFLPDWRIVVPLALATLLLALGVFLAWQSWLVLSAQNGAEEADRVRAQAIAALAAQIQKNVQGVQQALADPAVQAALTQDDPASRAN